MKSRILITIVSTLVLTMISVFELRAQIVGTKGDYIWEMGYLAKSKVPKENFFEIDFNTDPPNARFVDRVLQISRTSASYCNDEGRLLAYSNGIHIADSTYQIMEGGDSISFNSFLKFAKYMMEGGFELNRRNIFLPISEQKVYYLQQLITIENNILTYFRDLLCAEISFDQMGPGQVVSNNQIQVTGDFESSSMNACRHANGRDWWILLKKTKSGQFYSCLLDPDGLKLAYEYEYTIPNFLSYAGGFIFSPNGKKCIKLGDTYGAVLFDFDRQTGVLSDMIDLKTEFKPISYSDAAFSSNNRFLYTFNNGFVLQYDLINPDSVAFWESRDTIAKYDPIRFPYTNFVQGNLAPDGKIYIAASSGWDTLSVINYPDRKGKACGFDYDGFALPTYNESGCMPNFPQYRMGPIDGSESDSLGINNIPIAKFRVDNDSSFYNKREFIDLSFLEPTSWSWDFGDGSFSSDTSPVHWFPSNGTYGVCLTVGNTNGSDTHCRVINIGPVSASNLLEDYGLTLSPNPCRDFVILNVKEKFAKTLKMTITDVNGKSLQSGQLNLDNGFTTIDVRNIPAGSYFMTLMDGEGGQEVVQFVKQ